MHCVKTGTMWKKCKRAACSFLHRTVCPQKSFHAILARNTEMQREPVDDQSATCWICLGNNEGTCGNLVKPCACPRHVHDKCLARWQLQSAGQAEEGQCRFCECALPDWKGVMTPPTVAPCSTATMAVVLNGSEYRIVCEPGEGGRAKFESEIRRLFQLADEDELEFTFDCQAPDVQGVGGGELQLHGGSAYEAAFHCASLTAALKSKKNKIGV